MVYSLRSVEQQSSFNDELKKLSLMMSKNTHRNLKRLAMEKDTTITAIVLDLVDAYLDEHQE